MPQAELDVPRTTHRPHSLHRSEPDQVPRVSLNPLATTMSWSPHAIKMPLAAT